MSRACICPADTEILAGHSGRLEVKAWVSFNKNLHDEGLFVLSKNFVKSAQAVFQLQVSCFKKLPEIMLIMI